MHSTSSRGAVESTMVIDNSQWHQWWAWYPIFVPSMDQPGAGHWIWLRSVLRRWRDPAPLRPGYWHYCLDHFELIRLQALEQQSIDPRPVFSIGLVGMGTCSPQQLLNITTSSNRPSSSSLTFNSVRIVNSSTCQQKNPPAKIQVQP
jgi:hypothetical protein